MAEFSFLTNHAKALVCIARDPGVRLRDIAATLNITDRTAFGIVCDLIATGYVAKEKEGRRNRYRIQAHVPLGESVIREQTMGSCWRSWPIGARTRDMEVRHVTSTR